MIGTKSLVGSILAAILVFGYAGMATSADENTWHVSKASGEVWVNAGTSQPVSLTENAVLKSGDNIRTGQNGRVLLTRGEETILVSPNSVVGLPQEKKNGISTTILQQAGSILLNVEKRNDYHFEVETPYLVAVVKGTQFRVTVGKTDTSVNVLRGKVEVADFKSGQYAFVLPGQSAKVSVLGRGGLSLSGAGVLSPIQKGNPRSPSIEPALKSGTSAQHNTPNEKQVRISAPLGEVKLDVNKATKGMARPVTANGAGGEKKDTETVWNATNNQAPGSSAAQGSSGGNSGSAGGAGGGNSAAGGNGNGNGNGYGHLPCNPKSKGKSGC